MVSRKTVPLSVRVSDDDAAFLSSLKISGAATPSEKLRAILASARTGAEGRTDETESAEAFRTSVRGAEQRLRAAETDLGMRSDLARKLFDRVPELMAALSAGPPLDADQQSLSRFEDRLAIQAYALVEELLELGSVSANRAYDPARLSIRVAEALSVVDRVKARPAQQKGKSNE